MCRPRVVRITEDELVSTEVTIEVFEWSIGAMRCCSIFLASASVPGLMYRSVFTVFRMFINILEPVWSDRAITPQHAPENYFLRTKWAILMLTRPSLFQKRIQCSYLFTWPIRWKFPSSLKKMDLEEIRIHWLMVCPKARTSALFAFVWSKICFSYWNKWRSWCIMRITELLEISVSWNKYILDFVRDCSQHCLGDDVIFCPDCGRPLRPLMSSCTLPSHWICPGGALLWGWLERFCT